MSDLETDDESRPLLLDPVAERLLRARTILISGEITQKLAANVSAQLMALAGESDDPITMFINSQGGHVEAGDTVHDLVRFVRAPVRMVGTGWVASAGALIYVASERANRFCLPNTRFLLPQPAGGMGGSASDIAIEAKEIINMRDRLNRIFARATNQPLERIEEEIFGGRLARANIESLYALKQNLMTLKHAAGPLLLHHEALLRGPSPLTVAERSLIEHHPRIGLGIIKHVDLPAEVLEVVGGHHEKLDGSGYPYHMKSAEIPFQTKMMMIADMFDALTARDRPYKKAMPVEYALKIIGDEVKSEMLDPILFKLFVEANIYQLTAGD